MNTPATGGYYGWVWPSGSHIIRAELTAGKVATLLSGDTRWMNLARSQVALLRSKGFIDNGASMDPAELRKRNVSERMIDSIREGIPVVPRRYDERGWYHYNPEEAYPYVNIWYFSQEQEDWSHIERLAEVQKKVDGKIRDADLEWAYFVKGRNPGYAERAFSEDLQIIARKVGLIQDEHGDPETWVDNKWINSDPMVTRSLNRFSTGGIPVDVRGEMLYSQVRYFDGQRRRSGLPPDVAALVSRIEPDWIELEIINLNVTESRQLIIQGGAYGEHQFISVEHDQRAKRQRPTGQPNPRHSSAEGTETRDMKEINASAFTVNLAPGAGSKLRIYLKRYSNKPSYAFPWTR
ncbi:MAG: hypothetical protein O3C43_21530 [Verrucomicrobia bacterium]|nr:hypothetical protein [Verrucomicrobiota bacterium]